MFWQNIFLSGQLLLLGDKDNIWGFTNIHKGRRLCQSWPMRSKTGDGQQITFLQTHLFTFIVFYFIRYYLRVGLNLKFHPLTEKINQKSTTLMNDKLQKRGLTFLHCFLAIWAIKQKWKPKLWLSKYRLKTNVVLNWSR